MGADYSIICRCCGTILGEFYITRNYNSMFPFWMLYRHLETYRGKDKKNPFFLMNEYKFLLKTVRNALKYYAKGNIYNYDIWEAKMKTTPEYLKMNGWETNKYTMVCALIRFYWHLKRFPFDKYQWSCWY